MKIRFNIVLASAAALILISPPRLARADEQPSGESALAEPRALEPSRPLEPPRAEPSTPGKDPQVVPEPFRGEHPRPRYVSWWSEGARPPVYLNVMIAGGGFVEDDTNRLTTRDSNTLQGIGGILRVGGVLNEHSLLGARLQSFYRPTKMIRWALPLASSEQQLVQSGWGQVYYGYLGPEYTYLTRFGLYASGSLGLATTLAGDDAAGCSPGFLGCGWGEDIDNGGYNRGSIGFGAMASLGYEWRIHRWFAMNAELFLGYYHGVDQDERDMDTGLFGLAAGIGF